MSDLMHDSKLRNAIERENPRASKEWFIDIATLAAIVGWHFLSPTPIIKMIGYFILIGYLVSRYQSYKKWNDAIESELKRRSAKR